MACCTEEAWADPFCRVVRSERNGFLCFDILCPHEFWRLGGLRQRPLEIAAQLGKGLPDCRFAALRTFGADAETGGCIVLFSPAEGDGSSVPGPVPYTDIYETAFARLLNDPELAELLCGSKDRTPMRLCEEGYIRLSHRAGLDSDQPCILLGMRQLAGSRPVLTLDIIGRSDDRERLRALAAVIAARVKTQRVGSLVYREADVGLGRSVRGWLLGVRM